MPKSRQTQTDGQFTGFYTTYWPKVVVALAAALPVGEDAADVAQEAFARAYERWDLVRALERPDGWVFLTAYREASSIRRRLGVRRRHQQLVSSADGAVQPQAELSLTHLLADLPQRQRAALLLHYHYGFSTSEIARCLRCTQGTVKSLLHRGRNTLRTTIEQEASA